MSTFRTALLLFDKSIDPIQLDERKTLRRSKSIPKRYPVTNATKRREKDLELVSSGLSHYHPRRLELQPLSRNASSMVSESSSVSSYVVGRNASTLG
jgi:hypothetical protein